MAGSSSGRSSPGGGAVGPGGPPPDAQSRRSSPTSPKAGKGRRPAWASAAGLQGTGRGLNG
eukprot:6638368-Lingulodinium_polyedra.AAC.1